MYVKPDPIKEETAEGEDDTKKPLKTDRSDGKPIVQNIIILNQGGDS